MPESKKKTAGKPVPKRKVKPPRRSYTDEERAVILALLAANGHNLSRTERETGVARSTLMRWAENPPDATGGASTIAALKTEIQESYLAKAKRAREVLLDRMIKVAADERDLFKISGAFKIVSDATGEEEVNHALATRIGQTQTQAAPSMETARTAGSPDPALN
ncbi:hypothetical protein [Deinococcus marmoris]|uniref:hypothetical protein n=1 Tax=Deinococcus marmoris TaxID=249408 RepID=UPI001115482C|nr:hypothetical protein [Deinococcus marmoris]